MPARNPEAVRQRAIAAARQRTGQPATPTLDPVFVALNPGALPARERSPAELYQWVRRDEEYATLGANVVVELNSESHARQPTTRAWAIIRRADRSHRLAGSAALPARPWGHPRPRSMTPTLVGTLVPPPATRTPPRPGRRVCPGHAPSWGQSAAKPRPTGPPRGEEGRAEWMRFARLIHAARPRSWRTFGPRRLRRQSHADRIATQGGIAWPA